MKLAFLYAGQGSQHPGMGADLYDACPEFRAAFDEAAAAMAFPRKAVSATAVRASNTPAQASAEYSPSERPAA